MNSDQLQCAKCNVELTLRKVRLTYLGHDVLHDFPCCPKCGQVFIDEAIATGRMHEVETMVEDK
jgi:Zn-finger nucleic acid-binding protein